VIIALILSVIFSLQEIEGGIIYSSLIAMSFGYMISIIRKEAL